MKVLLDENLDHKLRKHLGDHACQQNLAGRQIAIVTLSTIDWTILRDNLSLVVAAVDNAIPGSFQAVECGTFSRKQQQENQIEPEQEQEQDRERER